MLDVEQLILAAVTGGLFGILVAFIGSSWQRLALFLLLLWTMQTAPQYVYRALDGANVTQEVVNVTLSRSAFAITAVVVLALVNRYREGRHG
jgi:ABC-type sugar transport system permease subunit